MCCKPVFALSIVHFVQAFFVRRVAAHLVNGCKHVFLLSKVRQGLPFPHKGGHSMCGPCGYQWIVEKVSRSCAYTLVLTLTLQHRNTCPVCRTPSHGLTPLIPNITVDHFVQKHLRVRALLGDEGWKAGGMKLLEWQERKE